MKIHPSPALVVRADTAIDECVRLMNKRGVGSLLVVSDNSTESLIGIFTERDLLKRADLIAHGSFWERPIRLVMTRGPMTLELSRIAEAGKIMVERGFRHLPIVIRQQRVQKLVGVVSMRDLFQVLLEEHKETLPAPVEPKRVLAVSADPDFLLLMRRLGMQSGEQTVQLLAALDKPYKPKSPAPNCVILDIDGFAPKLWAGFLKQTMAMENIKTIALVYNPTLHADTVDKTFSRLKDSGRFALFTKPVNIIALSSLLE